MTISDWHAAGQTSTAFFVAVAVITFVWQWVRDPR